MRAPQSTVPPLFRSDPEENFNLWVQNCFPGASLTREDAIRQWLARPTEARNQYAHNYRSECAESDVSERTWAAAPEVRNGARSQETSSRNLNGSLEWNSRLNAGTEKDRFLDRSAFRTRNSSKFPLRIARYSLLALLIVILVWGIPTSKSALPADASTAATRPSKAQLIAASVPVPPTHEAIEADPILPTGSITIENLSVGCEDTQPCIEISTRGKGALPRLSTLSDPDRVVMDFQDAVVSSDLRRKEVGRGVVKAVRIGVGGSQPPHARIVVDLTEKCDYELHTLTNGIVMKVYRKGQ
jgi:hypothetical protein